MNDSIYQRFQIHYFLSKRLISAILNSSVTSRSRIFLILSIFLSLLMFVFYKEYHGNIRNQPPSINLKNWNYNSDGLLSTPRISVIIRAHHDYAVPLVNLLWNLESQDAKLNIYAIIIPTEKESKQILKKSIFTYWPYNNKFNKFKVTATVLEIDDLEYDKKCCELASICTTEWRKRKISENWQEKSLDRYCLVNSPLHYHLTDIALSRLSILCPSCEAVMITNADNSYSPKFLSKTLSLMDSNYSFVFSNHIKRNNTSTSLISLDNNPMKQHYDIVMTNMVHLGHNVEVEPELSKMDLGCAIINAKFIKLHKVDFIHSLPIPTEPQHYHDADYWFIKKLLDHEAKVTVVREILFNHN